MRQDFKTERDLTNAVLHTEGLVAALGFDGWRSWRATEVEGLFGIPDIVFGFAKLDTIGRRMVRIVAFEVKRRNWRRGLAQAFRYSAFSHYSFVLVDANHARPASENIRLFRQSNIGLITMDRAGRLSVRHRPRIRAPYTPVLYEKLKSLVMTELFQPSW